ncbi:transcription factor domain-containing protein [Aspergillus candidus]|uniref:Fungal-specific transcription factor domain-domain-containing protein n=1 Tax=Aspergillus candidus TaxID=41067 RepID=A0A2I2F9D9_ASPCN|nr:fungal-specific transcription factor domain-domain-containing protein [Aspergillus candidus]PLB37256.1 fungal-specific transcription factor domain-domain-containing protein [Aspergillus candidus]
MTRKSTTGRSKTVVRACQSCRGKKIRCDASRPRCTPCISQNKECVYRFGTPRERPTLARINDLERERSALTSFIESLKDASVEDRDLLLSSTSHREVQREAPRLASESEPQVQEDSGERAILTKSGHDSGRRGSLISCIESEEDELDVVQFISIDESGNPESFGPSSALYVPPYNGLSPRTGLTRNVGQEHRKNSLIANAALQRQAEHRLAALPDIAGVPTHLALHLLNVHWARQHHTFLLTYRPAIMRDIQQNGPHSSAFLLNAIFACSSKFSDHAQAQPLFFLERCDQLLAEQQLLIYSTIPTVVGLLLLGSTYNSRGETSKGWLFTGYALRMVYDFGLHLDPQETSDSAEEIEIRRRIFWGAFICDKLQSLYLGRPPAINVRDCQVSRDFLDTFEEMEAFISSNPLVSPIYSVSTFRQLCALSKIMTVIINRFYAVGATVSNAVSSLQMVEAALQKWEQNLPPELDVSEHLLPRDSSNITQTEYPAPNVLNLHGIHQSLIILLHRPFISDGHLRATTVPLRSWEQCTLAADRISAVARCYKQAYGLAKAPYIMAYCIYVACTIHVRNAASEGTGNHCGRAAHASLLTSNLDYLDEMCATNPGVKRPASIIRKLISANNINLATEPSVSSSQPAPELNLEFIFGTFPGGAELLGHGQGHGQGQGQVQGQVQGQGQVHGAHGMALDVDCILDPLFGFMDTSMMPKPDNLPDSDELTGGDHMI